jgi:hypothetical protein
MPRVKLPNETDDDGQPIVVEVVGEWPSHEAVLEAHGYDPDTTDYELDDPQAELAEAIDSASDLQELKDAMTGKSNGPPVQANNRRRR